MLENKMTSGIFDSISTFIVMLWGVTSPLGGIISQYFMGAFFQLCLT